MNSVIQKESPPIDLSVFDVKKCFDALWLQQCCNYLYESGVTDDKLAMPIFVMLQDFTFFRVYINMEH